MGRVTKINLVLACSRRLDSEAQEKNSRKIIEVRKGNKGRELEGNAFPRSYPILPSFPPPPLPRFPGVHSLPTIWPPHFTTWTLECGPRVLILKNTPRFRWHGQIYGRGAAFFAFFPSAEPGSKLFEGGGGGGSITDDCLKALGMHNPEVITRTNTQIIQNSCDELINYAVIEQTE